MNYCEIGRAVVVFAVAAAGFAVLWGLIWMVCTLIAAQQVAKLLRYRRWDGRSALGRIIEVEAEIAAHKDRLLKLDSQMQRVHHDLTIADIARTSASAISMKKGGQRGTR